MREREVSTPDVQPRLRWGDPRIIHPEPQKALRPAYCYEANGDDHYVVTLNRRHVADLHRRQGGWSLFAAANPSLEIAWAGSLPAMRILAPEALPAQDDAMSGTYAWCLLRLYKVEVYTRPLDVYPSV